MTDMTKMPCCHQLMWYNSLGLLDLKSTTTQVVEMSVIVNSSPILNYARPDNHATPIYRCIINNIHPQRPRRCCLPIGHNNTKHFCAQSGANVRLSIWKWSSESGYPEAWKLLVHHFSQPDWPPLGLRGWTISRQAVNFNPLPTRTKYIQQPATFLNDQSSFLNDQTFGDFICLRTYIYVLGCWRTPHRMYIYVLCRQGVN